MCVPSWGKQEWLRWKICRHPFDLKSTTFLQGRQLVRREASCSLSKLDVALMD